MMRTGARSIGEAAWLSALFAVAASALGCAASGSHASVPVVQDEAPKPEAIDPGASYYEAEIGGMNEEAVDGAFAAFAKPVHRCVREGSARLEALGGSFTLSLRIERDGSVRSAYLRGSTLGDRETEACLLDAARSRAWPKPVGGPVGFAEKTFEIDAVAAPSPLDAKRVRQQAALAAKHTAKCRHGVTGTFLATAYLKPDGHVLSAGVAPPSQEGEEVADCVVLAIRKLRFASLAKGPAKVSFEIR